MAGDEFRVRRAPQRERYELWQGEKVVGFATVRVRGEEAVFPHVEVDPELGGRGLGTRLVREALEDVRARGLRPVALCPFVVAFLERNPQFAGGGR